MQPVRMFVGYDSDQTLASQVFAFSVVRRASVPVSVQYVMLSQMHGFYGRKRDPKQSTEFAFSRFMVPYLCQYTGFAIFADGDMLCLADIRELWEARNARHALQVVQRTHHNATPDGRKFLGHEQTIYPRKNWSSVMLFNCAACTALTPEYVQSASGLDLHRFTWLQDSEIAPLTAEWNHLVGVDEPNPGAKIVHYTLGMPFFHGYGECEYAREWRAEREAMMHHARNGECGYVEPRALAVG